MIYTNKILKHFRLLEQSFCLLIVLLGFVVDKSIVLADSSSLSTTVTESLESSQLLCPGDIDTQITSIIQRPEFQRSRWGILIKTLQSSQTLYASDADKYFVPASNAKLLTTAAVLLQFGSQFHLRTSVYGTGTPPILNTLKIVGQGDPSLTTEDLKKLVQQLKNQGIQRIKKIIIEDNYHQKSVINPTWEWEDLHYNYAPSINRLILNKNAVTLTLLTRKIGRSLKLYWSDSLAAKQWEIRNQTVTASSGTANSLSLQGFLGNPVLEIKGELAIDSQPDTFDLAIINPTQYFLESFRQLLISEGIIVNEAIAIQNSIQSDSERELAYIESPPLALLIQETNQESDNLYAEALLKLLTINSNSITNIEALQKQLTVLGIEPEKYKLVDGSGLSRHNLVTPEALVKLLTLMAQTPEGETFKNSLAVAGISGTLQERFKETSVVGRLKAKTGTLSGNAALSGYLDVLNYQPLAFSIIVNNSDQSSPILREAIDEIILILSHLKSC